MNHNVQSIRFIRERDPNWFVGTDKQDYLSCEFKKKIEYSKKKKFYLQGKKSNRSKEYWKSLEICTSFVRSLIEPASFLIQDLFRDESYSKELCSRGVREDSLISNSFQRTGGARLDDDWTAGRSTFRQMKTSFLRGGRGEVSERRRGRDARLRNAFTVARHLEKRPRTDEF